VTTKLLIDICDNETLDRYSDDFIQAFKYLPKYILVKEGKGYRLFPEDDESIQFQFPDSKAFETFVNKNKIFRNQLIGVESDEIVLISQLRISWIHDIRSLWEFFGETKMPY